MIEHFWENYSVQGFVRAGIIFCVLMLPNIFYFILPKYNGTELQSSAGHIFDFLETGMRMAYFAVLFGIGHIVNSYASYLVAIGKS